MSAYTIIRLGLFNTAVNLMDDEIREAVHEEFSPCTELEFLKEYMKRHKEKYGKEFTV